MKPQELEITDIYKSAYLLCSGADLSGIRFKSNKKRIALFMIKGDNLAELDRDYRSGRALVNPLQLRECLNLLRDILFDKLRDPSSSRHKRDYAAASTRTRNDRKRKEPDLCPASRIRRYNV